MADMKQLKIVIVGDSGVGKTCLVRRLAYSTFSDETKATLGAMYISKILELPDTGEAAVLQIWDTAGQERYRSLAEMHYKDAAAAILVYDLTKKASLDSLFYWIDELRAKAPKGIKLAVAANKADLIEAQAGDPFDAHTFADSHNAIYKMTSAKDGTGVKELFSLVVKSVLATLPSPVHYYALRV